MGTAPSREIWVERRVDNVENLIPKHKMQYIGILCMLIEHLRRQSIETLRKLGVDMVIVLSFIVTIQMVIGIVMEVHTVEVISGHLYSRHRDHPILLLIDLVLRLKLCLHTAIQIMQWDCPIFDIY